MIKTFLIENFAKIENSFNLFYKKYVRIQGFYVPNNYKIDKKHGFPRFFDGREQEFGIFQYKKNGKKSLIIGDSIIKLLENTKYKKYSGPMRILGMYGGVDEPTTNLGKILEVEILDEKGNVIDIITATKKTLERFYNDEGNVEGEKFYYGINDIPEEMREKILGKNFCRKEKIIDGLKEVKKFFTGSL